MTYASTSVAALGLPNTEDVFIVNKKQEEEEEIVRLEAEMMEQEPAIDKEEEKPSTLLGDNSIKKPYVDEADIDFKCACGMEECVHYYGKTPQFAWGINLLEDCFIMRDPFQPSPYPRNKPKAEHFIIIGAKCTNCQRTVCRDATCSFYYTRTFCLDCAEKNYNTFPIEAQKKLKKQLEEV